MNLIETPWLLTEVGELSPLDALRQASRFTWQRPDWNATSFCFLHALVQTAVVLVPGRCPDRDVWNQYRDAAPMELADWLTFDLGDRPWECVERSTREAETVPVAALLADSPGENTIKQAKDISRWKEEVPKALSASEAAIALMSDNLWGTRIGSGHRQGARGEQSLTTLLEPTSPDATLWQRVWLNVLPADEWTDLVARSDEPPAPFAFPWQQPLPTRDQAVTPLTHHSLAILWQMPRRWYAVRGADGEVESLHRIKNGRNYDGWELRHPLTPYWQGKDGNWFAAKVRPHTGFQDWAAITLGHRAKSKPAAAVTAFLNATSGIEALRLRCCGWALGDAGDAGVWVEHAVPFYAKTEEQVAALEQAVFAVEHQLSKLEIAIDAIGKTEMKANLIKGLKRRAGDFYTVVEPAFFARAATDDWAEWPELLRKQARRLFWELIDDSRVDLLSASKAARSI
jgi:CRISPR system Cascade subunit CasA